MARLLTTATQRVGGTAVAARVEQATLAGREYGVYTAGSLEESIHRFEGHFGMSTDSFLRLYAQDRLPGSVTRHAANTWAGVAEELSRLRDQAQDPDALFAEAGR